MRLQHPDYIKLLMAAYKKKCANQMLPLLAKSTPAKIKRECLNVYTERYNKSDDEILRAFFGPTEHGRKFSEVIRNFETDRFRPLDNYLKGNTENTDDINLELLAWLIDFEHRPFVYDKQVVLSEEELSIVGKTKNQAEVEFGSKEIVTEDGEVAEISTDKDRVQRLLKDEGVENLQTDSTKNSQSKKRRRIIIGVLIASACLTYFILQQRKGNQIKFGSNNTGCMYWADDHYEAMPCNEEPKGRLKLPIDSARMKNFKKILRKDTITISSIGKIYYLKIDGRIEFYTTGGNHPVDVTRELKPLSLYIYKTHLEVKKN